MCIPRNSENPELANEFINFMLSHDSALDNSRTVGYTSPDKSVLAELCGDDGEYAGNNAYLFDLNDPKSELFYNNETLRTALSELWIRVKAQ